MRQCYKEIIEVEKKDLKFRYFLNSSNKINDEHINVHPHWHDMVEILYVENGCATQQINEKTFEIEQGDVVIICSQNIHSTYSGKDTDIQVFQFGDSFINREDHSIQNIYRGFNDLDVAFAIKNEITKSLNKIRVEFIDKKVGWELSIIAEYMNILCFCIRNYKARTGIKARLEIKQSLAKVFEFIEENYSDHVKLEDVVRISNYSVPHFCRLFKDNVGMSFFEYLNRYRIKIAVDLLSKDKSITQISQECGFSSINSFIRSFKKIVGASPGKYRKDMII